ncbi:TonB family protein [uncultured Sporomusa sp.]|uniref:TonB family protein n=1 Tax=uncultured Sporomusa sp. TaxID=307249 RepID=A0A212M044_9FIRM|nr:energy transducer TonB [uncultured Sporomusa sp.]SCM83214.1 TonB family protein [uncultured Sporomusa sp.]
MPEQLYWRRALIASCFIHCLIFVGAGWLGGSVFSRVAEPEYIEMELISGVTAPEQAAAVPAIPQKPNTAVQPAAPADIRPAVAAQRPVASAAASEVVAESFSPAAEAAAPAGSGSGEAAPALAASGTGVAAPAPGRIAAPQILSKVEPVYPDDARQDGFTGTVGVRIEVLANGRTGEVRLARSSGRGSMDEAALQAVRKWRFVPARDESSGQTIRCFTTLAVVFKLK